MQPYKNEDRKDFIRITRDEANSEHVEDLLKRQMSLRGETGITRSKGRRWYYQNWFVFMMVATVAAITAWAIIEPYFDDLPYVQGPIEQINVSEAPPRIRSGNEELVLQLPTHGYIQVRGQKVWIVDQTMTLEPGGSRAKFDLSKLQSGQEVGVYAEYMQAGAEGLAVAAFIIPSPVTPAPTKATLSFRQLNARTQASSFLLFALVGGLIGLAIGAIDGLVCRLLRRALIAGAIGLAVGFVGGFISNLLANLAYAPLSQLAMKQEGTAVGALSTFGFLLQMGGRALAWGLAGITMGLGQGIAMRSRRLLVYGLIGGVIGGLLGGLAFDPVDLIMLGGIKPSSHVSRAVGIALVGASVGAMIGIVELLARDAWLRMTAGPLTGKEFLIFKDVMNIGSSPRSDIYLFNDAEVADLHATIRAVGDECEIENRNEFPPAIINGRSFKRSRLRHGDEIRIGRTVFVFEKRQK